MLLSAGDVPHSLGAQCGQFCRLRCVWEGVITCTCRFSVNMVHNVTLTMGNHNHYTVIAVYAEMKVVESQIDQKIQTSIFECGQAHIDVFPHNQQIAILLHASQYA